MQNNYVHMYRKIVYTCIDNHVHMQDNNVNMYE